MAVQAAGSASIVDAIEGDGTVLPVSGDTVADSISVSLPRDGLAAVQAVVASGGFGVRVGDDAILAAIPEVARLAGVFGEPAGVTAFAGIRRAASEGKLTRGERIAMLVTGNGLKDVASVMKVTGEPIPMADDVAALIKAFG
jgi:threonine synthase